jgi:chorismate lyase/3-hydroxybenzoate synthase
MEFASHLGLAYLTPREFDKHRETIQAHALGVVAFSAHRPPAFATGCPFVEVTMPVLSGDAWYEVWTTRQPISYSAQGEIASARSAEVLFGSLQVQETHGASLDSLVYAAYVKLFDFVDREGYGDLLRIWHYLPHITEDDDGLERYQRFSAGRNEAFMVKRGGVAQPPAACALGSQSGPLVIYFVAARGSAGTPMENPRQMSAYRYPPQYGPRSPTFSRASLANLGGDQLLFISGTASIVGHRSMHLGDPAAQTRETIANIRALFPRASEAGFQPAHDGLRLKVYVRHAEHFPVVRDIVTESLGPLTQAVYLQADICRAELLLEIEGVCLAATADRV